MTLIWCCIKSASRMTGCKELRSTPAPDAQQSFPPVTMPVIVRSVPTCPESDSMKWVEVVIISNAGWVWCAPESIKTLSFPVLDLSVYCVQFLKCTEFHKKCAFSHSCDCHHISRGERERDLVWAIVPSFCMFVGNTPHFWPQSSPPFWLSTMVAPSYCKVAPSYLPSPLAPSLRLCGHLTLG